MIPYVLLHLSSAQVPLFRIFQSIRSCTNHQVVSPSNPRRCCPSTTCSAFLWAYYTHIQVQRSLTTRLSSLPRPYQCSRLSWGLCIICILEIPYHYGFIPLSVQGKWKSCVIHYNKIPNPTVLSMAFPVMSCHFSGVHSRTTYLHARITRFQAQSSGPVVYLNQPERRGQALPVFHL